LDEEENLSIIGRGKSGRIQGKSRRRTERIGSRKQFGK
jgi:hypothetical protein